MNVTTVPVVQSSAIMDAVETDEINETLIWELNEKERSLYSSLIIFLVVVMIVGIIGNILVLIIYKTKFKRTSARVYILSLALTDLSVCVIGLPYHILDLTLILTYKYTYVCKTLSFLIGICTLSSVFILLVVGLDRYLKVCRPLKKQIIDFGDRKACLIAVIVGFVISIPNGILYGQSSVETDFENVTGVECFIDDEFQDSGLAVGYFGFNLLIFILSVLYLIIIYGFICKKIYKHDQMSGEIGKKKGRRICCCTIADKEEEEGADGELVCEDGANVGSGDDDAEGKECESKLDSKTNESLAKPKIRSSNSSSAMIRHRAPGAKVKEKNTRKITLMMLTITVVFIISYLPFIVISILDTLDPRLWYQASKTELWVYDLLLRIYLINNVANPIIYGFWDARFRKETLNLLKKMLCIKTTPETTSLTKTLATSNTSSKCRTEHTIK